MVWKDECQKQIDELKQYVRDKYWNGHDRPVKEDFTLGISHRETVVTRKYIKYFYIKRETCYEVRSLESDLPFTITEGKKHFTDSYNDIVGIEHITKRQFMEMKNVVD